MSVPPRAFISYSWDSENHKLWVKNLAKSLRSDGVDVTLDQWENVPGDKLPKFMEKAIDANDLILIICTPRYKIRSDNREGGVGYEGDIMTAEVLSGKNKKRFIPIIKKGNEETSMPTWLAGRYFIDFRKDDEFELHYSDLLVTLHGEREKAPPIGPKPNFKKKSSNSNNSKIQKSFSFTPIKIEGVIVDEVTSPSNDGSRGSALYKIPFKLTRTPSFEWSELFKKNWDRPRRYTSMHRPGIARVIGNKIILDGTRMEEIEKYHRDTLVLVVKKTNEEITKIKKREFEKRKRKVEKEENHKQNIKNIADGLDFNE